MEQTWIELVEGGNYGPWMPALTAALQKDESVWEPFHTIDGVINDILDDKYYLWVGGKADGKVEMFALTQILTYPACRSVSIIWCGGENGPDYFGSFTRAVEMFAEYTDCKVVEITGRPGWMRALKEFGYNPVQVVMRKEIPHGQGAAEQGNPDEQGGADSRTEGADAAGDGTNQPDPVAGHAPAARSSGV